MARHPLAAAPRQRPHHARILRVALPLACVAAACVTVPASAEAAQLVVGNDPAGCPSAGYTTIQSAVDAASAGDTIAICPGTYVEGGGAPSSSALTIEKSLTIRGAGAGLVTIEPNPAAGAVIGNASGGQNLTRFDAIGNVVSVDSPAPATAVVNVDISGVTISGGAVRVDSGIAFTNATGSLQDAHVTSIDTRQVGAQSGIAVTAYSDQPAGDFPVLLQGDLIDNYNKGGLYVSSMDFTARAVSGSRVRATLEASRIEGLGRQHDQGQNGAYIGDGAAATISGSTIADNYDTDMSDPSNPGYAASVGLLFWNADLTASSVTASNLQGNGYGLANADANGVPRTDPLSATGNWWGAVGGPSPDVGGVNSEPPAAGDRTQGAVTSTPFLRAPAPYPVVPATPAAVPPTVAITGPSDGSVIQSGAPTTISATANDDVAVQSVTFRVGTQVLATDTTAPYTADYTPTADEADTAQSITATATDVTGQSATVASAVHVAAIPVTITGGGETTTTTAPPPPPPVVVPPPAITFASPAAGKVLKGATTLTALPRAQAGVASVAFYDGTTRICTDTTAPYTCRFTPSGRDVGSPTITATVTDGLGQTASTTRTYVVRRFAPHAVTVRTTAGGVRHGARTLSSRGTVALPRGVTRAQGCDGSVLVTYRDGSKQTQLVTTLSRTCTFRAAVQAAATRRRRVGVRVAYLGGQSLAPRTVSGPAVLVK